MKYEWLLLLGFFIVVVLGFGSIVVSVSRIFTSSVNSVETNYFTGDNGINE